MILVVSGLPRSGTSMVMQMLAAGGLPPFTDSKRAPDPSNPRGYLEHDRVKSLARDAAWVGNAEGHALKVVAPLLPLLPTGPSYRVVFVERDMGEVLRSQAAMLAAAGGVAGRDEILAQVFARQLADAKAWATMHADAVVVVEHRALVEHPLEVAQALASFAGGHLDARTMAAVVDPSLYRQRTAERG